jgi:hypothetical protein
MVQRPMDLDTTCSLALLQEEVAEGECTSPRQLEHRYIRVPARQVQLQLPFGPTTPSSPSVDSRGMDAAQNSGSDKLNALRDFRRNRLFPRYINIATTRYNELVGATAQSSLKEKKENRSA